MSDGHMQDCDVLIVGGGMVGLMLANALKNTPLSVVVVERAESEPFLSLGRDCRVSAIVEGNIEALKGVGVWQFLEKKAGPIRGMRVWDGQHEGSIRFEALELGLDQLGCIVENHDLQAALKQGLKGHDNVSMLCPATIEAVHWTQDAVQVRLADGRNFLSRLIVGADGIRSWLRGQAGVEVHRREYHQKGIVATIRTELPHHGMAFQRFLPTGPLAFLPLSGSNEFSIVWSTHDDEAERLVKLDDAGFAESLYLAFGPMLGKIVEAGERAAFPLAAQLSKHLVRPRTALIGDAAHGIHPLAGLGVNLGLRDAMVLAQELSDARRFREDIGSMDVLERYMKLRLPDVLSVMGSMEGFHLLFANDYPWLPPLRALGMRVVGNSGPLKRFLMRSGMGLNQPVPKQIS